MKLPESHFLCAVSAGSAAFAALASRKQADGERITVDNLTPSTLRMGSRAELWRSNALSREQLKIITLRVDLLSHIVGAACTNISERE